MISKRLLIEKYMETKSKKRRPTKFEYSVALLKINDPYVKHIRYLQSIFRSTDLTRVGIEKNLHVTILFGIKKTNAAEVKNVLLNLKQKVFNINITDVDMFTTDSDVIYLKCESPHLYNLRQHFETLPHIKTHEYKPHITLAYLKPGTGKYYLETLRKVFKPTTLKIDYVYVSDKNSNEMRFKLSSQNELNQKNNITLNSKE